MTRVLNLHYKDLKVPIVFQKISRDIIYGKNTIEKRGEDGIVYTHTNLTMDGTHILPTKGTTSHYIDPKGNYVVKTLIVNLEGYAILVVRSMFKKPVKLSKRILVKGYFNYDFESIYVLTSVNLENLTLLYLECEKLINHQKFFKFPYAYYDTTESKETILIPKDNNLFIFVGKYAEPIMISQMWKMLDTWINNEIF